MKVLTILGARPQFIKAAAVSRSLAVTGHVEELIVHTGQHYDASMSQVFFDELGVPAPRYNLEVGSAPHGAQTGRILERLEEVVQAEKPDTLLIYGDTNSTLAGVLVAAKLQIPVAHVEAGMRSFNRKMPEEVNRVVADHLANLHFCATRTAVANLQREGVLEGVHWVGDVMLDVIEHFREQARGAADGVRQGVAGPYAVVTCHRAENTDEPQRMAGIVRGLNKLSQDVPILFPVHPRTRKSVADYGLSFASGVRLLEPLSYVQMLDVLNGAAVLLTDSGGMQKEAFYLAVPCVTLRDETEWVETLVGGWNQIAGPLPTRFVPAARAVLAGLPGPRPNLEPFGGGHAAKRITSILVG